MERCLSIAIAAVLAAGISNTCLSQTGGAGGAVGGASSGAASGGASTATGGTPSGTAGAVGQVNAGTAGTVGRAGASGNARAGNGGANANVGVNNGNRAAGVNGMGNSNGISQTPFFRDPGARRQLNLNDNQYNSLNQAYQNAYTRYNQGLNGLNNPNMTEQQREMQMQQLEGQFNQNLSGSVNNTLTDPQMRSRFSQLNRQFNGFNAFNDPAVRKQLNLTQDQIRQLRTLSSNWRQQMQQIQRGPKNGRNTLDDGQWQQLQQQYATQLNTVLTPEQQQMWSQQTGQAYSFSPNAYFGGQQNDNIQGSNQQAVDPRAPKYFPDAAAGGTSRQGTQTAPGTSAGTATGTSPVDPNAPKYFPDAAGGTSNQNTQSATNQSAGTPTSGSAAPATGTQGTTGGTVR